MKSVKRLQSLIPAVVAAITCALWTSNASSQELGLYAGPLTGAHSHSYSWAINYTEGFGKYFAGSIEWLNEGHIPGHHRDGQVAQVWLRYPVASPRFVLSVGAGPYRYFDTEAAQHGGSYSNTHGWGLVYSARATYYSSRRWTANLQLNRVQIWSGPSSTALQFGIGYQLDAPDEPGPRAFSLPRTNKVTQNEVTVMVGETILNSLQSESSVAEAIEYRRGLTPYLDATVGYLHEGNGATNRRHGLTAELWLTRAFLADKLTLGIGAGTYAAVNRPRPPPGDSSDGGGIFSGIVSISASYRFTDHWAARLTWNRIVTRYSRDTDVILGGIGYRF